MNIGVVGLGNVGLCSALSFASRGFRVVGVDIDGRKVELLAQGKTTIYERAVPSYLSKALSTGRITFSMKSEELRACDLIFITVGTPSLPSGEIDLSMVLSASRSIARTFSNGFPVVVIKSTTIPGTTAKKIRPALEKYSRKQVGKDFGLCSNPEFLREGHALADSLHPDKIVIGSGDTISCEKLLSLYKSFYGKDLPPVVLANYSTAEMIKYANNAFLALKVSYINTIARMCEKIVGCDVGVVADAIGLDRRIGRSFLEAGPGYGGSCFPKDTKALIGFAEKLQVEHGILTAVDEFNENQAVHIAQMARQALKGLRRRTVAVLGLAFKAETDDVRESSSLRVIRHLLKMGARVQTYDPKAMNNAKGILGDQVIYEPSVESCIRNSDACILMVEWKEFTSLQPREFKRMKKPIVIDARRVLDARKFKGRVQYYRIGLGK